MQKSKIKFEDLRKEYDEMLRQTQHYAKWRKAKVDENICRLLLERHPNADPNTTVADLVDGPELVEIIREAETMAEAFIKSTIEEKARELYRRLVTATEPPATKQ
jgi:hypothetical protein